MEIWTLNWNWYLFLSRNFDGKTGRALLRSKTCARTAAHRRPNIEQCQHQPRNV